MPRDIKKIFETSNIATLLDETELAEIAHNAILGYESDDQSRAEWKEKNKKGMELAMQMTKKKSFPHENAANVMYPLISIASIQFASRAYPNLIPGWDIVKAKVVGKDLQNLKAKAANRVSTHMNYQLNEEMTEWEEETDKLFMVLPILGSVFKKTYYSKNLGRIVSLFCSPEDIVMNYRAKCLNTVPRLTEKYNLYPNEIVERVRAGLFLDEDYSGSTDKKDEEEDYYDGDEFRPSFMLEQHTWLDLDNDGYKEPYLLNIHYGSRKVARIVPRFNPGSIRFNDRKQIRKIEPDTYHTKFSFIPSPDGSIYDVGFGNLLSPINNTVNTTINQLLDSGTISNSQGGFLGKGINLGRGRGGGPIKVGLNEWLPVAFAGEDLKRHILPLPKSEPSLVLFQLLGFMVQAGEKMSSVTELLMGEQSVQNEPATTSLARIEQGLSVFSAIHKRIHRSFGTEFGIIYKLNSIHLDDYYYYRVLDDPEAEKEVKRSDYDKSTCDIIPTSNPSDVSNTQKVMKSQILMSLRGQGLNDGEIMRRHLEALQEPDIEALLDAPQAPPDPKIVLESEKIELERDKLEFEMMKFGYEVAKIQSETIKNIAEAEAKEAGQQLEMYKAQAESLLKIEEMYENRRERLQGVVEKPGGPGGQGSPQGTGQ